MRICTLLLCAVWLRAQDPTDLFSKAPPDIDQVVRAKISEFYDLNAQKKYRASEKLVCEESRDIWYEMAKSSVKSAEIVRMRYEDEFKKAIVTTQIDGEMVTPHGTMPTKYVATTTWRLEGGNWCLQIPPPPKQVATPWGVMQGGESPGKAIGPPPLIGAMPPPGADPQLWAKQAAEDIFRQVKFSRTEAVLKGHAASQDEIEIRNGTPGTIDLSVLAPPRPGLSVKLTPEKIEPGQAGKLSFQYVPPDPNPKPFYELTLTIDPYRRQQKVRVVFDIPESVKQKIPSAARPKK